MIRGKQRGSRMTAARCPGLLSMESSLNYFRQLGVAAKERLLAGNARHGRRGCGFTRGFPQRSGYASPAVLISTAEISHRREKNQSLLFHRWGSQMFNVQHACAPG